MTSPARGIGARLLTESQHITRALVYGDARRVTLAAGVGLEDSVLNVMCGTITIGAGTMFGHRVMLLTGSHKLNGKREIADQGRDIWIGEDCWLASGCIILGPCTIGDRCVIAAGSVVTRDCQAGWLYAGNPAKRIRLAGDVGEE